MDIPFFDADTLIDAEEMQLLRDGEYDQIARDKFVKKLISQVDVLLSSPKQDLIVAEAFTKEKNRYEFMDHFPGNVCYIMINTPIGLAKERAQQRCVVGKHVINDIAFEHIWSEFETPRFLYFSLSNVDIPDVQLVHEFTRLIELVHHRRGD